MQTQRIELGLLQASNQPRPLNTADIDKLAASLKEVGLIQPITVWKVRGFHKGLVDDVYQIMAGHHRVAAARALGWTEIDAIVKECEGHLQAELIEIDENLVRSELTPAQRIQYTSRRAEIREALNPEPSRDYSLESYDDEEDETGGTIRSTSPDTLPDGRKKGPQHHKAFAAETAALTGQSKQEINRQLAVGKAIGEDLQRVVGTSLDKGVELVALAKLPEPERKDLIERAAAGEKVTARPAPPTPTPAPTPPAPTPAPLQPPVAAQADTVVDGDDDDAEFFATEVRLFLDRVRAGLGCNTNDEAGRVIRDALHTAPEDVFARYSEASTALKNFLDIVASGNE